MDRKKAKLNIIITVTFKVVTLILTLLTRKFIIDIIGKEANGLHSLFTSILGFLSIAELGLGTAIIYSMYKPIVENDQEKTSALYYLFKKIYKYIALIVITIGLILTPFIHYFAKDSSGTVNIEISFIMFLFGTALTYFFAHKTSLINAYKDNYITNTLFSLSVITINLIQILTLTISHSFILFNFVYIIGGLVNLIGTNIVFKYKYRHRISDNRIIAPELKQELYRNSKAMLMHKLGRVLINTSNNIVISALVGVSILGLYSNYVTIIVGMNSLIILIFTSLTSIIGHAYRRETPEEFFQLYLTLFAFNVIIGFLFYLGYIATVDDIIKLIFGSATTMNREIVLVLGINYFIQYLRQVTIVFRDATGVFYRDRYKALIEGLVNLILSLVLVQFIGITGVLISTIITNVLISNVIEPFVLYENVFHKKVSKFYLLNYISIIVFVIIVFTYELIPQLSDTVIINLVLNGILSIFIVITIVFLNFIFIKPFRKMIFKTLKKIR